MIQIAYNLEHREYCDEGCYGCCGDDRYEYRCDKCKKNLTKKLKEKQKRQNEFKISDDNITVEELLNRWKKYQDSRHKEDCELTINEQDVINI